MRLNRVRSAVIASALVAAFALPAASASGVAPASTDWPSYERNIQHSSASFTDPAITQANAAHLKAKWTFNLPAPTQTGQPKATLWGSPTVVGGKVYIGSGTGVFYALNATTGKVIWQRLLDYGLMLNCASRGIASTATVVPDPVSGKLTVYIAGSHLLYALDAGTGAVVWKTAVGPAGGQSAGMYYNWSSPTVAGGRIFMGVSSDCEAFHVRAGAVSYNQHTGALQHTYYDMPAGSFGGSVWSSPATDGTSVWLTTGDPQITSPTVGDSYSVVRLSASTLVKQDRWRTTDTAAEDFDFGSTPVLFPGTIAGKAVSLVGACNKNGMFYAWNRNNLAAGPVWAKQVGNTAGNNFSICLGSGAYDYVLKRLYIASNTTTVNGVTVPGAIRALNPNTGAYLWQKPLDCSPLGTPTLNGTTGLVAVPTYGCASGKTPSVQLYNETTGAKLATLPASSSVFSQPVFADGLLFVGAGGTTSAGGGKLTAYGP
ncbi:MAG TPA: PQQ-binding-like beta-propeller repeat protein [Frankiaceae bacterium]|jgi:polyvinyl alcohol dehydrogenase (cytochrome)|nr:PQQ-binding-like beta-propeller repeat protein [Frankiaceae bacterium]